MILALKKDKMRERKRIVIGFDLSTKTLYLNHLGYITFNRLKWETENRNELLKEDKST